MESTLWRRSIIRLGVILALVFSIGLMTACDGGGGSSSNPAEGSNWDEMGWDQGKWG
jgi:hypothetical protein